MVRSYDWKLGSVLGSDYGYKFCARVRRLQLGLMVMARVTAGATARFKVRIIVRVRITVRVYSLWLEYTVRSRLWLS